MNSDVLKKTLFIEFMIIHVLLCLAGGDECAIILRGYSTQTINFILFEEVYNESEKEFFNCININVYVIF